MAMIKADNITRINEVQRKLIAGEAVTIAFLGDSVTWGSDPNADRETTNVTADNGDTRDYIRTNYPMPETVGTLLNEHLASEVTIVNLGFPGDDVLESATHWTTSRGADLFVINFGLNDENTFDFQTFEAGYRVLIDRWFDDGAGIVLAKPTQRRYKNTKELKLYEAVIDKLSDELGCAALEPNLITEDFDYNHFSNETGEDQTHFNDRGYQEYARAMSGYFLGSGLLDKKTYRSGDFIQMHSRQIDYHGATEYLQGVVGGETRELYGAGKGGGVVKVAPNETMIFPIYTELTNLVVVPQFKITDGSVDFSITDSVKESINLFDTLRGTGSRLIKPMWTFAYSDSKQVGGAGYFSLADYRRDFLAIDLPVLTRKGMHLIKVTNNSTTDCLFSGVELIQEKTLMALTTKVASRSGE